MKKILSIFLALTLATASFAQTTKIPQRLELVQLEDDNGSTELEVFNMPEEGQNHYFLSVGHLGIGDDIIQFNIDPIFELFIPLGDTVSDALVKLQEFQGLFKGMPGDCLETEGCLSAAFPKGELEPVQVAYRKLILSRMLEFSVQRGDYIRSTTIPRASFNSMISSLKFYQKLHPNEP